MIVKLYRLSRSQSIQQVDLDAELNEIVRCLICRNKNKIGPMFFEKLKNFK